MKFVEHFGDFLRDEVNLNQTRLDTLEDHVAAIENYLRSREEFRDLIVKLLPQGSWAHSTIIKPKQGKEFDADVLLELKEQAEWEPKDYLLELRRVLNASERYKDRTSLKTRCVRVQYAGDCHVDIVPFIRTDGSGSIVNRVDNAFEPTNPEGFTSWFDEQDRNASGQLRRVARLVKYLRDIKVTFTAKSVILTTLLAERVDPEGDESDYTDLPSALPSIITALADYLDEHPDNPPSVADPSTPGANFDHRWPSDPAVYQNFRAKIRYYADKIDAAFQEADRATSMALWREVFGDSFGYDPKRASLAFANPTGLRRRDEGEQFIDEVPFNFTIASNRNHRLKVGCWVDQAPGFRPGDLSRFGYVGKGASLTFSVRHCTVPQPYDVFWKVKNQGVAATQAGDLRGQIYHEPRHEESTRYRGQHWVECYIVKDGACVASQRYVVRIV